MSMTKLLWKKRADCGGTESRKRSSVSVRSTLIVLALIVLAVGSAARTRLGDPAFGNNHALMNEIPTRDFGDKASARITDVRTAAPTSITKAY